MAGLRANGVGKVECFRCDRTRFGILSRARVAWCSIISFFGRCGNLSFFVDVAVCRALSRDSGDSRGYLRTGGRHNLWHGPGSCYVKKIGLAAFTAQAFRVGPALTNCRFVHLLDGRNDNTYGCTCGG